MGQSTYTLYKDGEFIALKVEKKTTDQKATLTASDFDYTAPASTDYTGEQITAAVTAKSDTVGCGDITVYYKSGSGAWTTTAPTSPGTYQVGIAVTEGAEYKAVAASSPLTDTSWKFTIAKGTPTAADFTFNPPTNLTYDGSKKEASFTPSKTGIGTMTVKYYDSEGKQLSEAPTDAGDYTVKLDVAASTISNAAQDLTDASWKFTVVPADTLTVTGTDYTGTYDGQKHGEAAVPSVTDGTTVKYSVNDGEWSEKVPTVKDVETLTVKVKAENKNYVTAEDTYTLTVNQAEVTAEDKTITYGDPEPELTAKVTGTVGKDTVAYTVSREPGTDVGEYVITPSGDASQGNYAVTFVSGKLTVDPSDALTVSGEDYTGVYDGQPHGAEAVPNITEGTTVQYSVNDGTTWVDDYPTVTDVDTVTVTVKAENKNYVTAKATYTLTVTEKDLADCTVEPFTLSYIQTGDEIRPSVTVKDGDKVLTEEIDYTVAYSDNVNAGTATVTVSGKGNYKGTAETTFRIVTLEGSSKSKLYNYTVGRAWKDAVVTLGEDTVLTPEDLKSVSVDGEALEESSYTVEPGCIKITLTKDYLNTLKVGEHTLTVELKNDCEGMTYEDTFKVRNTFVSWFLGDTGIGSFLDGGTTSGKDGTDGSGSTAGKGTSSGNATANSGDSSETAPNTGDESRTGIWITLALVSVIGLGAVTVFGRRRKIRR